jgi:hypothetical protein
MKLHRFDARMPLALRSAGNQGRSKEARAEVEAKPLLVLR